MHFMTFPIVTVILLVFIWQSEATKMCYKAKVCIHDGREKCGVDNDGIPRRFLDSCDLLEYNCLYDKTFQKALNKYCLELPPLEKEEKT